MRVKMKTVLLLLSFPILTAAQQVLSTDRNLPRAGDELTKEQVVYFDPGETGNNTRGVTVYYCTEGTCRFAVYVAAGDTADT